MKVRYIGPSPARRMPNGQRAVRNGDPVDVSEDRGKLMISSIHWEAADEKPRKSTKKAKE